MINHSKLCQIIRGVTYKSDYATLIQICKELDSGFLVQVGRNIPDSCSSKNMINWQYGRKWYISKYCCESEVLQTLLLAFITFEEHEAREGFLYKGKKLYGPHIDVSQTQLRKEG